jgi:hypothetical protein
MACFITETAHRSGGGDCLYAPTSITQCCDVVYHQCAGKPPKGPDRLPLETWRAMGCLPADAEAHAIGAAYIRAHGGKQPPRLWSRGRGPRKPAYSASELLRSLAALAPPPQPPAPPPPPPMWDLERVWLAAGERCELPSTRMLLLQKARLEGWSVEGQLITAHVCVVSHWRRHIKLRERLVQQALSAVVGRTVEVCFDWGVGE